MTMDLRTGAIGGWAYAAARKRRVRLGVVLSLMLLALWLPGMARAVVISEVCANNVTAYQTDAGDTPDWIELYNPEDAPVSLSGYWLSDDLKKPLAFELSGYTIGAKGYLLLCADRRELPFKLSSAGCEVVLSQEGQAEPVCVRVPPLGCDQSYSLQADGSYQITACTALQANGTGQVYKAPVYVAAPVFSLDTGFYDEPFALELSCDSRDVIHYTLDSSVPDRNAAVYTEALWIEDRSNQRNVYSALTDIAFDAVSKPKMLLPKLTVIRAVAVDAEGNQSKVVTKTYGVGLRGKGVIDGIAVLSIVADPQRMFDSKDGIYMLGKSYDEWLDEKLKEDPAFDVSTAPTMARVANFLKHGRLYEIPVSAQWIREDGSVRFDQTLGLRIRGNYSRMLKNKAFQLYARGEYGSGKIEAVLWKGGGKVEQLTLRNGGNDQLLSFRDVFAHTLLEPLGVPVSRAIPCILFLDGEYWGLYNLREEQNADYVAEHYGVYADDVVMIKNKEVDAGYGDELSLYNGFVSALRSLNCANEADYEKACALMDMENYTSYIAGGLYIACADWINFGNNMTYWRTRTLGSQTYADTRWRWFYQDMDHSSGYGTFEMTPAQALLYDPVFSELWPNQGFQTQFLTKVMDVANLICPSSRVNALLDSFAARYEPFMEMKYQRFGYDYTLKDFRENVASIKSFYQKRPQEVVRQLTESLALDKALCTLTIRDPALSRQSISVNGRAVSFEKGKWSGSYFADCPIDVSAGEVPGYAFAGWYQGGKLLTEERTLTISLSDRHVLTPTYQKRASCALLDGGNILESADGLGLISDTDVQAAALTADEGLALSVADGAVTIAPDKKWSKRQGITVQMSTAGYRSLTFRVSLRLGEGAPHRWRLYASLDGVAYAEVEDGAFNVEAGASEVQISLPDTLSDQNIIFLRLEAAEKQSGKDAAVALTALEVFGDERGTTLIGLTQCFDACQAAMGAAFERPAADVLESMTQQEINQLTYDTYLRLADYLVNKTVHPIGDGDAARYAALEGLTGETYFEIAPEAAAWASQIAVNVALNGTAYLYGVTERGTSLLQTAEITNGQLTLPATEGSYALLSKPIDGYRYALRFTDDPINDAIIQSAFGGTAPRRYLWMDVTLLTRYQEGFRIALPDVWPGTLCLYAFRGDTLEEMAALEKGEDGAYAVGSLKAGRYLALEQPLAWYQSDAKLRQREAADEADPQAAPAKAGLPRWLAAAGGLALAVIGVTAWQIKRRRKTSRR